MSVNLDLEARKFVLVRLDEMSIGDKIYQGTIDITEHIDFQQVAEDFDLTEKEYEKLIDDSQKLIDIAIKNYFEKCPKCSDNGCFVFKMLDKDNPDKLVRTDRKDLVEYRVCDSCGYCKRT